MFGQVFDFTLEPEEMNCITALNRNWRYIVPTITVSSMHSHILTMPRISSQTLCLYCTSISWLHVCVSALGGWEVRTQGCRTSPLPFQRPVLRSSADSCCALTTTCILSSCLPSSSHVRHKIKFLLSSVSMALCSFGISSNGFLTLQHVQANNPNLISRSGKLKSNLNLSVVIPATQSEETVSNSL